MQKKIITVVLILSMATVIFSGCGASKQEEITAEKKNDTVEMIVEDEAVVEDEVVSEDETAAENETVAEDEAVVETESAPVEELDYESFQGLSPAQQQEYMESFASIEEFFEWHNAARETYEKEHPVIELTGGEINLDEIINGDQ